MSLYRCLFCGWKGDDRDDFREPEKGEVELSGTHIEGSDYEWLVCEYPDNDCSSELKKGKTWNQDKLEFEK